MADNDVEDDDVSEATNTFRLVFSWCDGIRTHAACGGGLGQVTVQEVSSANPHSIPAITVERLQKCVSDYAGQLEPGHYRLYPEVKVDRDGMRWGVSMAGLPDETSGFAGCTRIVLNEMAISREILNSGGTTATNEVTEAQRSYMGSPAIAVIVIVGLSEIVLEAGAYTILFAVTVKVVDKAKDDVVEAVKRWRPRPNKNRCLDAAAGGEYLWAELCRAMSGERAAQCWKHANSNETEKRNMCNAWFGN